MFHKKIQIIFGSEPFGRNYSLRRPLMHHLFMVQMTSRLEFPHDFTGCRTSVVLNKKRFFVLVACTMIYSARCCLHR